MNYRHAYHAGNFADVFKHIVLVRTLIYLARKPAPFRVIDTHAGDGRYDLSGDAAVRTGEWRDGIGALDASAIDPEARNLIEPYLALASPAVDAVTPYPGSPALALALTRPFDRMIFCELHPNSLAALRSAVGRDKRAKVIALDGYTGMNAFIPPIERRGVILVDAPFEAADEFDRLTSAISAAHRKWRDGVVIAWFPIKDRRDAARLASAVANDVPEALWLELAVDEPRDDGRLVASGIVVLNPPYTLAAEMACVLPALARQLQRGHGGFRVARVGDLARSTGLETAR